MLIALQNDNTFYDRNHWASTRFNGNILGVNGGYRPFTYRTTGWFAQTKRIYGFCYWTDSGGANRRMTIEPTGDEGYVRCVRDVQIAEANTEYNNGGSLIQ